MTRRPLILAAIALAATFAAARAGDNDAARKAAVVELGRRLFFDPTASRAGRTSCASCHDPAHGFSDERAKSRDEDGRSPRHAQSLVDLGGGPFGWDGEFDTLREAVAENFLDRTDSRNARAARVVRHREAATAAGVEVDDPLFQGVGFEILYGDDVRSASARRLSIRDRGRDVGSAPVASRLAGRYDAAFRAAFGDAAVTEDRVVDALAAFVASLKSGESPFDRFRAGKIDAVSDAARRGFELFTGKATCATCHVVSTETKRSTFTDGAFHATGAAADSDSPGRAETTFVRADFGAFRTPGLRDVARRGPYFHDGSAATLEDVVRFYNLGSGAARPPLDLTESEIDDVVAFLNSLTGDVAGRAPMTPRVTVAVHVERLAGGPDSWIRLRVTPTGQPLGDARPAAFEVSADENGDARFVFPASTHVAVDGADERLDLAQPLPDSATEIALVATPRDAVSFLVRRPKTWRAAPAIIALRTMARAVTAGRPSGFVGRICPDASDMTLPAKFVRDLGDDESVYSMGSPGVGGIVRRWIFAETEYGPFDLDLEGGACNVVDLTRVDAADDRGSADPSPALRRLEELLLATRDAKPK